MEVIVTAIVIMVICWIYTDKYDKLCVEKNLDRCISPWWAIGCGLGLLLSVISVLQDEPHKYAVIGITAIVTFLSMRSAKKKMLAQGGDAEMAKKAMRAQLAMAPIAILSIVILSTLLDSAEKRIHKK